MPQRRVSQSQRRKSLGTKQESYLNYYLGTAYAEQIFLPQPMEMKAIVKEVKPIQDYSKETVVIPTPQVNLELKPRRNSLEYQPAVDSKQRRRSLFG
jgi:hypothetical protein